MRSLKKRAGAGRVFSVYGSMWLCVRALLNGVFVHMCNKKDTFLCYVAVDKVTRGWTRGGQHTRNVTVWCDQQLPGRDMC